MKTWIHVEKAFQDAEIKYQQKDWVFLCEIELRQFYYSPQSGKWRIKRTRAWQASNSVEDFIALAKECLRSGKESKEAQRARRRSNRKQRKSKRKAQKTKASSSQSSEQKRQELRDEVRPEFLELFDEKIRICNERSYKPAWIWKTLLDEYLLTPKEVCWLCTVFDYKPGWAYHQAKDKYPLITHQEILASIGENRTDWLKYFNSRWHFSSEGKSEKERSRKEESRRNRYRQQDYQRQKDYRRSTQSSNGGGQYQNYLHLLQLKFPFSRQELKTAYRKKALSTHPDAGGTTEAFRKVHTAFEILSALAG